MHNESRVEESKGAAGMFPEGDPGSAYNREGAKSAPVKLKNKVSLMVGGVETGKREEWHGKDFVCVILTT